MPGQINTWDVLILLWEEVWEMQRRYHSITPIPHDFYILCSDSASDKCIGGRSA